ncbi:hypothetical protein D9M70_645860 [compost metagenome]
MLSDTLVHLGVDDLELFPAILIEQRQRGAVGHGPLEVVDRHVVAEHLAGQLLLAAIDQRRAGEAQELRAWQPLTHVQRQSAVLRAVCLI